MTSRAEVERDQQRLKENIQAALSGKSLPADTAADTAPATESSGPASGPGYPGVQGAPSGTGQTGYPGVQGAPR